MALFARALRLALADTVTVRDCPVWGSVSRSTRARWLRIAFKAGLHMTQSRGRVRLYAMNLEPDAMPQGLINAAAESHYGAFAVAVRLAMIRTSYLQTDIPWGNISPSTRRRWLNLLLEAGFQVISDHSCLRLYVSAHAQTAEAREKLRGNDE